MAEMRESYISIPIPRRGACRNMEPEELHLLAKVQANGGDMRSEAS